MFCGKFWPCPKFPTEECNCYLDADHEGPCECGFCAYASHDGDDHEAR